MDVTTASVIALFVLVFGAYSSRLRSSVISAPMAFMVLGLICGKSGFGIFDLPLDNPVVLALAELTLVVVLFTDAARIDLKLFRREHDLPIRLLLIGLPLTIVIGTLVAWWLFPALGFFGAAVLATIVAPTDAALAHPVVTKRIVPTRIRQAISVESGLNDGMVVPALIFFLCYAEAMAHVETPSYWVLFAGKQIVLGPLVGIVVGLLGGKLLERAKLRSTVNHVFFQLSAVAIAILAYGLAEMVGGNGFISAFTAGIVVGNVTRVLCETIFDFGETEGQLLSCAIFFVFGAILFPQAIPTLGSPGLFTFAILSLTLVRIIPACLSLVGSKLKLSSRIFISWFGPRGVASIVFVLVLLDRNEIAGSDTIFSAVVLTVFLSVVAHGLSANPYAKWYSGHLHRKYQELDLESGEHRVIQELPFFKTWK